MTTDLLAALGIFAAFWFWLWAIVDTAGGPPGRFRIGSRALWLPVVVLAPGAGAIAYLVFGRFVPAPRRTGGSDAENSHELDDE